MLELGQAIRERHSTRMFLPRPVPRELVDEALALAQHAPSNSNIQPWRLVFASGAARNRLKDALCGVADHEAAHIPAATKGVRTLPLRAWGGGLRLDGYHHRRHGGRRGRCDA